MNDGCGENANLSSAIPLRNNDRFFFRFFLFDNGNDAVVKLCDNTFNIKTRRWDPGKTANGQTSTIAGRKFYAFWPSTRSNETETIKESFAAILRFFKDTFGHRNDGLGEIYEYKFKIAGNDIYHACE